jgi:hypothetical protein
MYVNVTYGYLTVFQIQIQFEIQISDSNPDSKPEFGLNPVRYLDYESR